MKLTVGSLFSGIGGLDLGLERAGMTVIWQSEIDPYCSRVLKKHWPNVPNLGDITKVDWSTVERPDVICGGYPCQPFALAGGRRGDIDPRHLWPNMLHAIRVLRPGVVICENVAGHLSLGFDRVLADFAELGFDAEWSLVSACSMGAPHLRERLFCVAHPASAGLSGSGLRASEPSEVGRRRPADGGSAPRPAGWAAEPELGRVAYGIPRRVERIRGLGNAVVPQVAEFIGRQLMAAL